MAHTSSTVKVFSEAAQGFLHGHTALTHQRVEGFGPGELMGHELGVDFLPRHTPRFKLLDALVGAFILLTQCTVVLTQAGDL